MQSQHRSRRTRIAATSLAIAALAAPAAQAGVGARSARGPPGAASAPQRSAVVVTLDPGQRLRLGLGRHRRGRRRGPRARRRGVVRAHLSRPGAAGPLRLGGRVARRAGARDHRGVPAGELIGRERELASLTAMLGDPEARLVTVTGPGGVGKTRLALAASEAVAPDRPDGVVRVDLAALEDARLVAEAIAAAAGAGSSRGDSALEAAAAALRDGRPLLVLDNFEHLEPAAADLGALLDACPGVTALVTSRHVLGLSAERTLPLAPLARPPRTAARPRPAPPSRSSSRAPGRATRVSSSRPSRRVGGGDLPAPGRPAAGDRARRRARGGAAARRPCSRAGTRRSGSTPSGARDLPSRQRTLRSAFDWSYDLLELPRSRRCCAGWPPSPAASTSRRSRRPSAATAACSRRWSSTRSPRSRPSSIAACCIARRRLGGRAAFSMLVTVRSYLRERSGRGGEEAAADLLDGDGLRGGGASTRTASSRAASRARSSTGSTASSTTSARRSTCCVARGAGAARWTSAPISTGLWERAPRPRGARLARARAAAPAAPTLPPAVRARALFAAAWLAHFQGDYAAGGRWRGECLAAARAADDPLIAHAGAVRRGRGAARSTTPRRPRPATARASRSASASATTPASPPPTTTSASSRGPPGSSRRRRRATRGRWRCGGRCGDAMGVARVRLTTWLSWPRDIGDLDTCRGPAARVAGVATRDRRPQRSAASTAGRASSSWSP